jgi:hypothetical protein
MFPVIDADGQMNRNWKLNIKGIPGYPNKKVVLVSIIGDQSTGKSIVIFIFNYYYFIISSK